MLLSQGEGFDPYLSALIGTPNLLDFALPCPFYKGLLVQITIKWDIRSAEAERLFHSKRYEVPLLLRVNQFPSYLYRSSPDDRYDAYR